MNERDTHFQAFADLLLTEIFKHFGRFIDTDASREDDIDEEKLRLLIAQRAYDLVYHALYCNGIDAEYHEQKNASMLYHQEVMKELARIPDLTEWPTTTD